MPSETTSAQKNNFMRKKLSAYSEAENSKDLQNENNF